MVVVRSKTFCRVRDGWYGFRENRGSFAQMRVGQVHGSRRRPSRSEMNSRDEHACVGSRKAEIG